MSCDRRYIVLRSNLQMYFPILGPYMVIVLDDDTSLRALWAI